MRGVNSLLRFGLILAFAGISTLGSAGDYKLADLEWMTGSWYGKGLGGHVEEHWSAPLGKTMVAVFRLAHTDKTPVIELLTIEEQATGIVFRFKHFKVDLTAWEKEPLTFNLVSLKDRTAVFEMAEPIEGKPFRMTYHSPDTDNLTVRIENQGESERLEVVFKRGTRP